MELRKRLSAHEQKWDILAGKCLLLTFWISSQRALPDISKLQCVCVCVCVCVCHSWYNWCSVYTQRDCSLAYIKGHEPTPHEWQRERERESEREEN